MKFLALLALTFSLNSFADTTIQRAHSSTNAVCQLKGDMGKRAYKLEVASETLTETGREIALQVTFLKCVEVEGKLQIVESSAKEDLHSYVLLANGEIAQTTNTLLKADFAATDKFDRMLGISKLDLNSDSTVINFSFDKKLERAFITAGFRSRIVLPTGEVINNLPEYVGGFLLSFK